MSDPPIVVTNPSEIRNPPNAGWATRPKTRCECERKRNNSDTEGHRAVLGQTLHASILAGLSKVTFTDRWRNQALSLKTQLDGVDAANLPL